MIRIKWWLIVGYWCARYGRFEAGKIAAKIAAQWMLRPDFEASDFSAFWWAGRWWLK